MSEYSESNYDPDGQQERWSDWEEEDADTVEAKCLFCERSFPTAAGAFAHCAEAHCFDFQATRAALKLDFYQSVRMINYIRKQVLDNPELANTTSYVVDKIEPYFDNDAYLKPILMEDPLLYGFEDADDMDSTDDVEPVYDPSRFEDADEVMDDGKGSSGGANLSAVRQTPDRDGFFGRFGGSVIPPQLQAQMDEITAAYHRVCTSPEFFKELCAIRKHYQGRPTPVSYCRNLSKSIGGGEIFLKREDLNHTGAHKLNHCIAEVLLAKHLGKKKVIAETGAGQHGVALATAASYFGLECEIHMGEVDMEKERPNVTKLRILGATLVPVTTGARTLKEAVDSAFEAYLRDPVTTMYCIGSVVGPHPFPMMVRDFQRVVGVEAREQMLEMTGDLPDHVVACVGGGSNAMGIFSGFLDELTVQLHAVEPHGKGMQLGEHAASLTYGSEGVMHGFRSVMLMDEKGNPAPVHSIASGLNYPSVGPEHSYLKEIGRTKVGTVSDVEAIQAFFQLSRLEGIIPALESAHAVAYALKLARENPTSSILVNLSGRGDKDIEFVMENFGEYAEKSYN